MIMEMQNQSEKIDNLKFNLNLQILKYYCSKNYREQFDYLRTFLGEKNAGPLTFVPWLKFIPPFYNIYNNIIESMKCFRKNLTDIIDQQR